MTGCVLCSVAGWVFDFGLGAFIVGVVLYCGVVLWALLSTLWGRV
jgi:hypothetical protein